jgi:hypothetical protein
MKQPAAVAASFSLRWENPLIEHPHRCLTTAKYFATLNMGTKQVRLVACSTALRTAEQIFLLMRLLDAPRLLRYPTFNLNHGRGVA